MLSEGLICAETSRAQPDSSPQVNAMPNLGLSTADIAKHNVHHGNPIEASKLKSFHLLGKEFIDARAGSHTEPDLFLESRTVIVPRKRL